MQQRRTKRQQQAIKTKNAIFLIAVDLFNKNGYENVTIEEITNTAGFAKGSFYTYFRSKSDILVEEFRNIDGYYRSFHDNLDKYLSATERMHYFTETQLIYVRDEVGCELLTLLYVNNLTTESSEKILIDKERYLHTVVKEMISYGQNRNEFRSDITSDQLATFYNRGMRAIFLDWSISGGTFDIVKEGMAYCSSLLCPSLLKMNSLTDA